VPPVILIESTGLIAASIAAANNNMEIQAPIAPTNCIFIMASLPLSITSKNALFIPEPPLFFHNQSHTIDVNQVSIEKTPGILIC
jgi:hypothetical protein